MFKKFIIFLFLSLIIFIVSSTNLAFFKSDELPGNQYYKVAGSKFENLTTIVQRKSLKENANKELLKKTKIVGSFTASSNNLGIIAIPLKTNNQSIDDVITFRLKKVNESGWYYQANYNANQFQNSVSFPFGFPLITNSKNISYNFELESQRGVSGYAIITDNYFFAKYKYSKFDLLYPSSIFNFLFTKLYIQTSLLSFFEVEILTIFSLIISFIFLQAWYLYKDRRDLFSRFPKKINFIFGKKLVIKNDQYQDILLNFLVTFSIIALFVILAGVFNLPLTGNRKWIPYISLLFAPVIIGFMFLRKKLYKNAYLLVFSGLFSSAIISQAIVTNEDGYLWLSISGLLLFFCSLIIFKWLKYFGFVFAASSLFLLAIPTLKFLNLHVSGLLQTGIVVLLIIFGFIYSLRNSSSSYRLQKLNKVFLYVFLTISAFLAFRSDSLSLQVSELHWGYFTGVISTIRSGGELLWSAPSQYGFLNLLIPSILPFSARNSFFIFQGLMFFIAFSFILFFAYKYYKNNLAFIIIGITGLSLFYLIDPAIIGPTPYPSSSIIRFFGVYLIFFVTVIEYINGNLLNDRIKWTILVAYVIGATWSGESLLYTSAIFFTYLISSVFSLYKTTKDKLIPIKFLFQNISIILIAFFLFNLIYLEFTSHFPDYSMYFMYAFNYAKGFGELPIIFSGIHWAGIIMMSAIIFILWRMYAEKKYDKWIMLSISFIALWAVGSYYVGRAVVNNFEAMLPLFFFIFLGLFLILKEEKNFIYRVLLTSVFLPIIIVGIVGGIGNPQFFEKVQNFKFAGNIDTRGFIPDRELGELLKSLGATNGKRIVYYGEPFGNPSISVAGGKFVDPLVGMPVPATLLEDPIPDSNKASIVKRFLNKTKQPFYFIYNKNEERTRVDSWMDFFKKKYYVSKELETENYLVYLVGLYK